MAGPTGTYGGRSAQERRADRRERFLRAALDQFGDRPGYRSATVAALCEAAGLSTRQFYEEFRNLEEVLAQLHLLVNDWTEQAVVQALTGAAGLAFDQRMATVLRAYVTAATADPRRLRIAFVEIIGVSEELERQRLVRRSRWVELIVTEAEAAAAAARSRRATTGSPPPPSSARSTACCTTGRPASSRPRSTRSSTSWRPSSAGPSAHRTGTDTDP